MELTFTFIRLFLYSIVSAAPLLLLFLLVIQFIGQYVGKKESWAAFDSVYWSLITATTVGYGDFRPLKNISKVLSIISALLGLMITGIIVALTIQSASIAFKEVNHLASVKKK